MMCDEAETTGTSPDRLPHCCLGEVPHVLPRGGLRNPEQGSGASRSCGTQCKPCCGGPVAIGFLHHFVESLRAQLIWKSGMTRLRSAQWANQAAGYECGKVHAMQFSFVFVFC
jgi:hypothetical protein